jgi:predicted RNase H-like nuclease (RuvC/YqgF family)
VGESSARRPEEEPFAPPGEGESGPSRPDGVVDPIGPRRPGSVVDPTGPRRPVALYALLAAALAFGAAMTVLYGVSRRRQGRVAGRLVSELELAAKERAELGEALAREKGLREEFESAAKTRDEMISSLREGGKETRQDYTRSESERRELSRISEEKSDELIQRHNRIVELQAEVERIVRERSETEDAAHARERELRLVYEAEVRNERRRRKELEEKLAVLDEIRDLRAQLARLADKMQELVQEGRDVRTPGRPDLPGREGGNAE